MKAQHSQPPPDVTGMVGMDAQVEALIKTEAAHIKTLALWGDEGEQKVEQLANASFNKAFGDGSAQDCALSEAQRDKKHALDNLERAQQTKRDTPESVIVPQGKRITLWRPQDIVWSVMVFVISMVMVATSVTNMQVNIMASDIPIFTDSPWKAWLISLVAAGAVFVIKMIPLIFPYRFQELAKRGVFALTIIVTVIWIYLFGQRFEGVGADFNIGDLLLAEQGHDPFVFVQILAEMLIAASLFTWLNMVWDRYIPNKKNPNPDYDLACAHKDKCQIAYDKAVLALLEASEALSIYQGHKDSYVIKLLNIFKKSQLRNQLFSD